MSNRITPLIPRLLTFALLTVIFSAVVPLVTAQEKVQDRDRERAQEMLRRIKDKLKKEYYDPKFRGMDVDVRFKTADDKIKTASSLGQIFGTIAQVLLDLDDSHTYFVPPERAYTTDYGWTMQIIGDRCFVSSVDKGSDAEAKGVKPGDEVLEAGGYQIDRTNRWKFLYLYNTLRPQQHIRVVLRSPNAEPRELDLLAKQTSGKKKIINLTNYNEYMDLVRKSQRDADLGRDRYVTFAEKLIIWKMNEFDLNDMQVDEAMEKVRKHEAFILDLRGNGGGWITTIQRVLANLVDRDVKIGDLVSRKETKPFLAKTRGDKAFKGKVIVLVDSRSASASEVLSRTIQLEKRGTVIGDKTAGAVMTSRFFGDEVGMDVVVFYGASITVSDLIMSDGQSLEHRGVTPDEIRLPTAEDLAAGRDTVLSYAASLVGVKLDPVEAGKLFPIVRPQKD